MSRASLGRSLGGDAGEMPDVAIPIVGWRAWAVAWDGRAWRLWSPVYWSRWPVGRPLAAACLPPGRWRTSWSQRHPGAAPRGGCACGIHAAQDPALAFRYLIGPHGVRPVARVIGAVSLWGRVVECQGGWRGACGYPARIFVPERGLGQALPAVIGDLEAYGVPVVPLEAGGREIAAALEQPAA
jgi:hypothetical protein